MSPRASRVLVSGSTSPSGYKTRQRARLMPHLSAVLVGIKTHSQLLPSRCRFACPGHQRSISRLGTMWWEWLDWTHNLRRRIYLRQEQRLVQPVHSWCSGGTTTTTRTNPPTGTTTTQVPAGSATLYLAGDSTTALDQGTAYQGWGAQIGKYLSIPVVNNAVAGKSSRSFTDLGYFSQMYSRVKSGDVVIIEFGHNEGGGPQGNPQQGVCPGTSLTTTCNDNGKTVYTYFKYMTDAINQFKAKGAKVIVSSQTPNNPFRDSSGTPIYVSYAQQVASQTSVAYVDHFKFLLTRYQQLGASSVNALFPQDNIHTNSNGANVAAQALIRGALCGSGNPLVPYVKNTNVQPTSCV